MKIKYIDFLRIMDNAKSLDELNIKCDLMFGENFKTILDKFCQLFGQIISDDILLNLNIKDLTEFLIYIGKNFEESNKMIIQTTVNYESQNYPRYICEYCIPDNFKLENISINI